MPLKQKGHGIYLNRTVVALLILAGITGWSVSLYSTWNLAGLDEQLRTQAAALQDYQAQYSAQRQKSEESARELANLRQELSSARSQIQKLTAQSEQAADDMAKAREQLAAAQQGGAFPGAGMSPEILSIKPRPTKEDIVAAQEALSQLRFGTIKADGAMGPSTREAIEKFQRAAGLPVTGELHAQTLVTLMRSAKVMAAQSDVH